MKQLKTITILLYLMIIHYTISEDCSKVKFNEKYYEIEMLKEGVNNVRDLAINRNTETLYFAFDLIRKDETSVIAYVNMTSGEATTIDGVKNARTVTVDQENNIVYVGGDDGIFTLNQWNAPVKVNVNDNVLKLFNLNDYLFYTTNNKKTFVYANGEKNIVKELLDSKVNSFVIDNTRHVFFIENGNLFRVKLGTRAVNIHEKYIVNDVTTDINGKLYVSASDGVYTYNNRKYSLERVSKLTGLKSLVFDKNNVPIYAVSDKIIKLNLSAPC